MSFFLIRIYSTVVLKEFLNLVDLAKAQVFCIHKLTEVIMVSKDKNVIFAAFQIMAPSLKDFNNS